MSLAFDPPVDRRPPENSSRSVSTEEAFEALSNRRRRYVVHWLLEAGTRTELRQLSRQVAAWENDKPLDRVTAQERRRVYNALQQFHLPKLEDTGVIRYDADRGVVEATDELTTLRAYLDASRRSRRWYRWCSRSLLLGSGLAALGTVLAAAWSLGALGGAALAVLIGAGGVGALLAHSLVGTSGRDGRRPTETDDR